MRPEQSRHDTHTAHAPQHDVHTTEGVGIGLSGVASHAPVFTDVDTDGLMRSEVAPVKLQDAYAHSNTARVITLAQKPVCLVCGVWGIVWSLCLVQCGVVCCSDLHCAGVWCGECTGCETAPNGLEYTTSPAYVREHHVRTA